MPRPRDPLSNAWAISQGRAKKVAALEKRIALALRSMQPLRANLALMGPGDLVLALDDAIKALEGRLD
jgi:hypothetical protein